MPDNRFELLFRKFMADSISPDELIEFREKFSDEQYAGLREKLLEESFTNKTYSTNQDFDPQIMFAEFAERIRHRNAVPVIPIRRKMFTRIAAAAAILILFSAGTYFLFFNKSEQKIALTQGQHFNDDILPGGNKATLTLGNGQQIVLDSVHNGTIVQQGNSKVIKTDSGKLAYTALGEKPTEVSYNLLTTPRGGQYQLQLPDGTKVWLNAASSVKYPTAFVGKERMVEITGEVYFDVVHNPKQPFKVKAGEQIIEDIGTEFNVNAYSDEPVAKTTLVNGDISVHFHKEAISVKPGQEAYVDAYKNSLKVGEGDIEGATAWKNGKFYFNGSSLHEVMRQLSRWYDLDVEFSPGVKEMKFNGGINRNLNASEILKMMKESGIHCKIENQKLVVEP
jgi:transmembrane sensor